MSYKIVNRPAVSIDITDAVNYYKPININLAKQFLFRLQEARTYISQHPYSLQVKYKNVRTLLLKQFPYHIHYLIDDDNKHIVILAIINAYKNPKDYNDNR
jgi:plasmid stabilization system protein ParE